MEGFRGVQTELHRAAPLQYQFGKQEVPERKGCDVRTPYSQDPHTIWTSPSSPNLTEEADPNRRLSKQRRCGRDTVQFLPKPPRMVPQLELRPPQYCYMTQPAHCALRLGALPHQPATHPGAPPTTATYSNPETAPATNLPKRRKSGGWCTMSCTRLFGRIRPQDI